MTSGEQVAGERLEVQRMIAADAADGTLVTS